MELRIDEVFGKKSIETNGKKIAKLIFYRFMKAVFRSALKSVFSGIQPILRNASSNLLIQTSKAS